MGLYITQLVSNSVRLRSKRALECIYTSRRRACVAQTPVLKLESLSLLGQIGLVPYQAVCRFVMHMNDGTSAKISLILGLI